MKKLVFILASVSLLILGIALVGCGAPAETEKTYYQFQSGSVGGGTYTWMIGVSRLMNKYAGDKYVVSVRSGLGNLENFAMVNEGKVKVSYAGNASGFQMEGKNFQPDPNKYAVRYVAMMPPSFEVGVAAADTGWTDFAKIPKGAHLTGHTKGTTSYMMTQQLFESLGITDVWNYFKWEFLGSSPSMTAFLDGKVDANIRSSALPNSAFEQVLAGKRKAIAILPTEAQLKKFMDDYGRFGYSVLEIPRDAHPNLFPPGSKTVADTLVTLAHKDVPDDFIYTLVKVMTEHHDELMAMWSGYEWTTPEQAVKNQYYPWHPGAEKYYREKGYLK